MKYVVEVCYGNRNEWSEEVEEYCDALNHARKMSELDGVSEARVWCDGEVVTMLVDGEEEEDPIDEWAEYEDRWDEVGYDSYGGCYDMDL